MNKLNFKIEQKSIIIILGILAIVLLALIALDIFREPQTKGPDLVDPGETDEVFTPVELDDLLDQTVEERDHFRQEVPENTIVPGLDAKLSEEEKLIIAVPISVDPAGPGASVNQRIYQIRAENDTYIPKEIIAYAGDVISIKFTAIDKEYDLVLPSNNMFVRAQKGETKSLKYSAYNEGSFSFYCSSCGGPDKGPQGKIIVVQP